MSGENRFVPLGPIHLHRVMEIERGSFANPWSEADFCYLLADRDALCSGLLHRGELIGYALGYFVGRDFHLANLAVDPACRKQGWAKQLLERILRLAAEQGASRCALEVRSANRAARALYCQAGFRTVGRRAAYYSDPLDDAVLMERNIEIL